MSGATGVRVVIVDNVDLEGKAIRRTLCDFGYSNVVHRRDVQGALEAIDSSRPTIVVTSLELGGESGLDLARRIRARDLEEYVYVIMLTGRGAASDLRASFDAGVDDFVKKPYSSEELALRVHAGERVVSLESLLRRRGKELETALRRIDVAAAQRALARADAPRAIAPGSADGDVESLVLSPHWRGLGALFASTLGDFLQLPFETAPPVDAYEGPVVADVLMVEPGKQLEVAVTVAVDRSSVGRLALHLLGSDEDLEGAHALVLEVANVLMGAVKASFVSAGLAFTGGIPTSVPLEDAQRTLEEIATRRRFAFSAGEVIVEVYVRTRSKQNVRMRAKNLKEGMVVSEDIRDARGMLLMRAGIRLTATAAERLARLSPDLDVAVSDPLAA